MPENPKGHDEDARSDQNSPIQADLDSARNHPPATQRGETRANNHEAVAEKLEQDIRAGERWLIWIGMTSVLINTVIGWIYWGQLVQMKEATRAAKISADAAAASVKTMRD